MGPPPSPPPCGHSLLRPCYRRGVSTSHAAYSLDGDHAALPVLASGLHFLRCGAAGLPALSRQHLRGYLNVRPCECPVLLTVRCGRSACSLAVVCVGGSVQVLPGSRGWPLPTGARWRLGASPRTGLADAVTKACGRARAAAHAQSLTGGGGNSICICRCIYA